MGLLGRRKDPSFIPAFTHSFMHSLILSECLLRARHHVRDTVKILSFPLESDRFWGDCQAVITLGKHRGDGNPEEAPNLVLGWVREKTPRPVCEW